MEENPKPPVLSRNDPKKPLVPNGARRPGQQSFHNRSCQMEDYGIQWSGANNYSAGSPIHFFWCATHGVWAHEYPIKLTYEFLDGTQVEKEIWPERKTSKIILPKSK